MIGISPPNIYINFFRLISLYTLLGRANLKRIRKISGKVIERPYTQKQPKFDDPRRKSFKSIFFSDFKLFCHILHIQLS